MAIRKEMIMRFKRIFLVVMDSVGIGAAKDAEAFHDAGTNTILHALESTKIHLPNFEKMGLSNLLNDTNIPTIASYTKAEEISNGKDTLTGHLEMMGVETKVPFRTFTETGFPEELIQELSIQIGRGILGNCNASGTEIIERLGKEHMETGKVIVYTSADSVLQIAAHEEIVPLKELYHICEIARELTLKEEWKVGRIIARPFIGTPGHFERTSNRHDYALNPAESTVLDALKEAHYDVISVGKIADIFNNCGITESIKTKDNLDGMQIILKTMQKNFTGLCFANLNDFDSKYGHRRNPIGYAHALKELDDYLPKFMASLEADDLLIFTADHGNDPTYIGTDHTREDVPVFVYYRGMKESKRITHLTTFASLGATVADNFNVKLPRIGTSFLEEIQ